MGPDVAWYSWHSMLAQVFLACADNAAHTPYLVCHDRRIPQMPDPDGRIHPFVDEVHDAVDEQNVRGHFRVTMEKSVHNWREIAPPKSH